MKRTQIYLEDDQDARLAARARAAGVTKSKLIRQAIDSMLAGPSSGGARLRRFRAAVSAAEQQTADLPRGADYVEEVRAADRARTRALDERRRR